MVIRRIRSTEKRQGMRDYPYIHAWEQMMHSSESYLNSRLDLARKEKAPPDAMWRSLTGKWHRFSEMSDRNHNKALVAAYIEGIEDETV